MLSSDRDDEQCGSEFSLEKKESDWLEEQDKETIHETTVSVIEPEGGWIIVEDSYVRMPAGAVVEPTVFDLELHGDSSETCPDGYIAISPKLVCKPEIRFACPVEVKLQSWCSVKSDAEDIFAYVACMSEYGAKAIDKISLNRARQEIIFETDRLSTFWVHIDSFAYNKINLALQPELFHHPDGSFTTFFANKGVISKEIRRKMTKDGQVYGPIVLDEITVKHADEISVSMRAAESLEDDDIFTFHPSNMAFQVDEDFIRCPQKPIHLQIQPRPKPGQLIQFEYIITHNGKVSRKEFILSWPGIASSNEIHSVMDEED